MLFIDELKRQLAEIDTQIEEMGCSFDVAGAKEEREELENKMGAAGFWDDAEDSRQIVQRIKVLKAKEESYAEVRDKCDEVKILVEFYDDDQSEENENELNKGFEELQELFASFKLATLLKGEYDSNDTILAIHPGAGGTESMDWAEMLMRMYLRYAERNKLKVTVLESLPGDVAGIKSATLLFEGANAYGYLKSEKGVHRLVRISPFDSNSRRQTSFVSVDIIPQIENTQTVEIDPKDLRIDTYRSTGAGGQKVNKTDSAVRITHIPTGIVVAVQNERSQFQNKDKAMQILISKLTALMEEEHKEKLSELQGDYGQIAWGNQIRSYVFCPYTMVKDHRTKFETANVQAVMDGDIGGFIEAYLKMNISE
ncbi:MAG: peptide chain release factor 2 [Eubacteriales bacterium]|nr:peptide chain release factor 2 [Eubacteriales bacterium]